MDIKGSIVSKVLHIAYLDNAWSSNCAQARGGSFVLDRCEGRQIPKPNQSIETRHPLPTCYSKSRYNLEIYHLFLSLHSSLLSVLR